MKLINFPNILTCSNLFSGCVATYFAFMHSPYLAMLWMIIGAVFDFFDGMSARALHISSPIGKELDSLADDVTFGVAPSTILFAQLSVMDIPSRLGIIASIIPFLAYIMAAFSALRLAKFNLDERQSMGFIGLPTPANALFWGSLMICTADWFNNLHYGWLLLIVLMLVSSWLLISEIPMFALKFKHFSWKGNELRCSFIIVAAVIVIASMVMGALSDAGILIGFLRPWWLVIAIYILLSVAVDLKASKK